MQIDLPKCCRYAPDGEKGPYIYFVKDGNRVLLPATYPFNQSNSEFWEKYAECLSGKLVANIACDTLSDLIQRYRSSDEFANLRSDTSRKKYSLYLEHMEAQAGDRRVQQFKKYDLVKPRDSMKGTPSRPTMYWPSPLLFFKKGSI
jgi:hypothetical protein